MKESVFFGLKKINLILIGIAFAIIVLGFVLMSGVKSGDVYNPAIFSARHVTVAPMISFAGFVMMIFAILYNKKESK